MGNDPFEPNEMGDPNHQACNAYVLRLGFRDL